MPEDGNGIQGGRLVKRPEFHRNDPKRIRGLLVR